ncbi:unnamed protein product, partial [Laminaria digitata]
SSPRVYVTCPQGSACACPASVTRTRRLPRSFTPLSSTWRWPASRACRRRTTTRLKRDSVDVFVRRHGAR